jgi:hypothetical protein
MNKRITKVMHTTDAGKELHLIVDRGSANFIFQWFGGGELPQALLGKFTDETQANKAVALYIAQKRKPMSAGVNTVEGAQAESTGTTFIDSLISPT